MGTPSLLTAPKEHRPGKFSGGDGDGDGDGDGVLTQDVSAPLEAGQDAEEDAD